MYKNFLSLMLLVMALGVFVGCNQSRALRVPGISSERGMPQVGGQGGMGAPGMGAPGMGAPGMGAPGMGAPAMPLPVPGQAPPPVGGIGVAGPGPGVLMSPMTGNPGTFGMPGGAGPNGAGAYGNQMAQKTSQIYFVGPDGMHVQWDTASGAYASEPLICPGNRDFPQNQLYNLKLTNIPGHAGEELYPTMEITNVSPKSEAYLAHSAVPIEFTPEDFAQVSTGNMVTKVIYLPKPEFQQLAIAGVNTLVSTRLDPGVDPVVEAGKQGTILAIIRMGNRKKSGGSGGGGVVQAGFEDAPKRVTGDNAPIGNRFNTRGAFASSIPGQYISGVNAPPYGAPMTPTSMGLAGPPVLPTGVGAGTRRYDFSHQRVRTVTARPQHCMPQGPCPPMMMAPQSCPPQGCAMPGGYQ